MNEFIYYILSIITYLIVILLLIAIMSFILYSISNKFNYKYIGFYGFFCSMDTSSLIMLSSAILKEVTLLFCVFSLNKSTYIYLYIFILCSFVFAFFSFNIKTFIKEFLISSIEYLIIFLLQLLSSFLVEVKYMPIIVYYIWIISIVLVNCSFFLFIRNLLTVSTKDKNVRRNLFVR